MGGLYSELIFIYFFNIEVFIEIFTKYRNNKESNATKRKGKVTVCDKQSIGPEHMYIIQFIHVVVYILLYFPHSIKCATFE